MMRRANTEVLFDVEKEPTSIFYILSVILCSIALLFTIVTVVYIDVIRDRDASVIPAFEEHINRGEYEEALIMYRSLQDQVVSISPDDMDSVQKQLELMRQMENIVSERVITIENKIRYERGTLRVDDLKFLNGMEELTVSQLSGWLNSLCEEFLLGTIDKPDITFIFGELVIVENIESVATPLLREIDTIERACGVAQAAENAFNEGDYIDAVKQYSQLVNGSEGFVYDFSLNRVEEIKSIMYEPMIEQCEHMLSRYQYYSAEEVLSSLAVIFPDDNRISSALLTATGNTSSVSEYYGAIEVLCIRQLISDTSLAFGSNYNQGSDDIYLTTTEFSRVLQELYDNNYVLVDAEGLVDQYSEDYLVECNLVVPDGKKPLVLIIENLDYSPKLYGNGTCERLVLNDQGQVCGQYKNASGQDVVQRSAEAIGILDAFVENHPDFSYNGVKGVISICGYESVFGYVVNEEQIDDYNLSLNISGRPSVTITEQDIVINQSTTMKIADTLKDTGWKFASSTYGNINAQEASIEEIEDDTTKWMDQIEPIVGRIHMLVYPNGNYIKGTDPRAEYLKGLGIRIFFGIGPSPYYTYGLNYLYYDRVLINGAAMRNTDLSRLFDVGVVYDENRVIKLE